MRPPLLSDCQTRAGRRSPGHWGSLLTALTALGCHQGSAPSDGSTQRSPEVAVAPGSANAQPKSPPAPPAAPTPAASARPPPEPEPRIYAKSRYVWIRAWPDASTQWIGYLWHGGSVKLKSTEPVPGPGCAEFYAIEPRGYVCGDGDKATLDPKDAVLEAVAKYSPNVDSPWPHRYAESLGAERYAALPSHQEQQAREHDLQSHLARLAEQKNQDTAADLGLSPAPVDPVRFASLPSNLQIQRNFLRRRSTIAYTHEARHDGRRWLLTADLTWVPKDRTEPYPKVEFQGVHLTDEVKLPIAFFRKQDWPQHHKDERGEFEATDRVFPRLGWVNLTGKREVVGDTTYLETTQPGVYTTVADCRLIEPRKYTPWGAEVGKPDTTEHRPEGRQTWIETSVYGGYLIAYEGTKPVFTTLISAGRGGTPVEGKEPIETASTPVGRFNITGKFITANMESPTELIHSDVPWTQNFSGPHALHGAYWHNRWGELMSGGCINVSPIDGKWLLAFTEPPVPDDWHGVRWEPKLGPSTTLLVGR